MPATSWSRQITDSSTSTTRCKTAISSAEPTGKEILYTDRRFVLGAGLREHSSFKTFQPQQLGLAGSLQVQIPKSINRLRLKGSGSRFVHGGATLQEVVIPVISINKKRQSDVGKVEVELIGGGGKTITTGQLAVVLYQTEPVTDKRQPRRLRVGLHALMESRSRTFRN